MTPSVAGPVLAIGAEDGADDDWRVTSNLAKVRNSELMYVSVIDCSVEPDVLVSRPAICHLLCLCTNTAILRYCDDDIASDVGDVFVAEESWHAARLIPTSGISGAEEQERRGTSALLAVLASVKEFGRAITSQLGAPAGNIETFIEVPFTLNGRRLYPDGLIRVTRGQRTWIALVEVKTGKNALQVDQVENYLDIAREREFQAVLTISNQIPTAPGVHPAAVDRRKCRRVDLFHLSWSRIHTQALMERSNRRVSDPDQAWILSELIRYLEHPRSGAVDFDDMGSSWVPVREALKSGTLLPGDSQATDVASRWEQLVQFVGMRMGRVLGTDVQPGLSRRELAEPALRLQAQADSLSSSGSMSASLQIPDTVAPIRLGADLRAGRVSCSVDIGAPREGRPLTRVKWLVRQLRDAPDEVRVDAYTQRSRGVSRSELVRDVRSDPTLLLDDEKREISRFQISISRPAGTKRGQGKGSFVGSVLDLVDSFYVDVVQNLKAWSPNPPRLRQPEPDQVAEPDVPVQLQSTSLSSQDDPDDDFESNSRSENDSAVKEDERPPDLSLQQSDELDGVSDPARGTEVPL